MFAKLRRALARPLGVIRLAVRVHGADAELVLADLLELAPAGVEEVERPGGIVEYAVYGAPGELPELPDLHAAVGDALVEISTSEIRGRLVRALARLSPAGPDRVPRARSACRALRVRPPWEHPSDRRDRARDRDRSRAGVRNRRPCNHTAVPGAAARAGSADADAGLRRSGCSIVGHAARVCSRSPRRDSATSRCWRSTTTALSVRREHAERGRQRRADRGAPLRSASGALADSGSASRSPVVLANLLRPLLLDLSQHAARSARASDH